MTPEDTVKCPRCGEPLTILSFDEKVAIVRREMANRPEVGEPHPALAPLLVPARFGPGPVFRCATCGLISEWELLKACLGVEPLEEDLGQDPDRRRS